MKPGWKSRSQIWVSPSRHGSHVPHPQQNGTVTRSPTANPCTDGPDLGDDAAQLVPRHVRQHDRRVMSHPGVPVAPAHAGRADLHHDPVGLAARVGDVLDHQRLFEGLHHGGAHRPIVAAVDPLSLPPDELRRLGHEVWDRLVDRWEALDDQPPISLPDPDWSAAAIRAVPGRSDRPARGDR